MLQKNDYINIVDLVETHAVPISETYQRYLPRFTRHDSRNIRFSRRINKFAVVGNRLQKLSDVTTCRATKDGAGKDRASLRKCSSRDNEG